MDQDRLARQMAFIVEADKVKSVFRQNTLADASRRENDAEHMWHFALMAVVLGEYAADAGVDAFKVVKMALIHDLVEIDAGDTFVYDEAGRASQAERERVAADRVFGLLPPDQAAEFRALWDEFEDGDTAEGRFARAIDRLNPLLLNYHANGEAWRRHDLEVTRVREVNRRRIQSGAPALWQYADWMIEDACRRGLLRPEK